MPRSLLALPVLALLGCPEVADDQKADQDTGEAGGGGSSGTTTSGTTTASGTQSTLAWDGHYEGEIIVVGEAVGVDGSAESCAGSVVLDVLAGSEPEIVGLATCSFSGWLQGMGQQQLHLSGELVGEDGAAGVVTVTIEDLSFEQEWTGSWEDDHLSAWFSGTERFELGDAGFEIVIEGSFTALRKP